MFEEKKINTPFYIYGDAPPKKRCPSASEKSLINGDWFAMYLHPFISGLRKPMELSSVKML